MFYAEQVEGFADDKIDEVIDALWVEIEPWIRRGDDRTGQGQGAHVFDIDEVQRRFAVADDEPAAFFERDGCGPGQKV